MVGFAQAAQLDFSLGMVRSVARNLIPPNGCYDVINGLLTTDGAIFKRGGSEYYATSDYASGTGVRFLWAGQLVPGTRVLAATDGGFFTLDGSEATVDLGGSGLTSPVPAVEIGGLLFIDGGTIWGGSRKTSNYSTGTVTATNGSAVVTGSGTSWSANVDAGMLFRVSGERIYTVESVDSNTQITLNNPYEGTTGGGKAYTLKMLESASSPYRTSDIYAVAGNKLISCEGNTIWESDGPSTTGVLRPHSFPTDNNITVPEGNEIVGAVGIGGKALIFCTGGVYVLSNVALDITDANGNQQQRLDLLSRDLILWGKEGIASWQNAAIVPCTDDVYLMDGVSSPRPISKSITPLYREYVQAGYKPGAAAVWGNHYLLPILDSANGPQDFLACRLDRPTNTRWGMFFPWTRLDSEGGNVTSLAVLAGTSTREPKLLAGSHGSGNRVLSLASFFSPAAAVKDDHDGSVPQFDITFGDIPTGQGLKNANLVRFMRLHYELVDAATDSPTIVAFGGSGAQTTTGPEWGSATWGSFTWTAASDLDEFSPLSGQAPADSGDHPYAWTANRQVRYFRPRVRSSGPSASLVVRGLELDILPRGG